MKSRILTVLVFVVGLLAGLVAPRALEPAVRAGELGLGFGRPRVHRVVIRGRRFACVKLGTGGLCCEPLR